MQLSIALVFALKLLVVRSRAHLVRYLPPPSHDINSSEEESFEHFTLSCPGDSVCTPYYNCYDDETNRNLNGAVDDRLNVPNGCLHADDVCCINQSQPRKFDQSSVASAMSISLQPQPQSPAQTSPSPDTNCICTPFHRCYDSETNRNLTGVVDDRINIPQIVCTEADDVCCYKLVQESTNPNPSPQPITQGPAQTSHQTSTISPSQPRPQARPQPQPRPQARPQPQPRPQAPSTQTSSESGNCKCTPFHRCYDLENNRNLTGFVDDRLNIPDMTSRIVNVNEATVCPGPDDICCYNLVQNSRDTKPSLHPKVIGPSQISPKTPMSTPQPYPPGTVQPANSSEGVAQRNQMLIFPE